MIPLITFDSLPEAVQVDGVTYPINSGYRTMMAIEMEMFGENNEEQKKLNSLNLFYFGDIPSNRKAAMDQLLWFFRCGEDEKKKKSRGKRRPSRRAYCFRIDAPLLYAAFRQQYQIDLRRTQNKDLHWWEFSALFQALSDDTKMAKVMYWRTCDLNDLPKEQKKFVKRMREEYTIPEAGVTMDSKMKLMRRNESMKEYVRKRMEECRKK